MTVVNLMVFGAGGFAPVPASMDEMKSMVSGNEDIPGLSARIAFIHENHFEGFLRAAADLKMYISVRATGRDTLDKLPHGYACKPHEILDKTLKDSSIQSEFAKFTALKQACAAQPPWTLRWWSGKRPVAFGPIPDGLAEPFETTDDGRIHSVLGICEAAYNEAPTNQNFRGLVGYWFTIELVKYGRRRRVEAAYHALVPMGALSVGPKDAKQLAKIPAGVGNLFPHQHATEPPHDCYTGDYDLHCIFSDKKGVPDVSDLGHLNARPRTPPEHTTLSSDRDIVLLSIIQSLNKEYLLENGKPRTRNDLQSEKIEDRYAGLIQHGPQNMYFDYVKATGECPDVNVEEVTENLGQRLPDITGRNPRTAAGAVTHAREFFVGSLLSVDKGGVLAFTPVLEGMQKVYILPNEKAVKAYYRKEKLFQIGWTRGKAEQQAVQYVFPSRLNRIFTKLIKAKKINDARIGKCNDQGHTKDDGTAGLVTQWAVALITDPAALDDPSYIGRRPLQQLPETGSGNKWNGASPRVLKCTWFAKNFGAVLSDIQRELKLSGYELNGEKIVGTRAVDGHQGTQVICLIASYGPLPTE